MKAALLPANLGALANLCSEDAARYTTNAVHLLTYGDGTYRAEATDCRYLGIVSGPCDSADEFPEIPALASAPNGESESLIPAKEWAKAFRAVPKAKRGTKPILRNVATVIGKDVTTFGTTDTETVSVSQPRNVEGRFPAVSEVIPPDAPTASACVNPAALIDLLKVASAFAGDPGRVTIEIRAAKTTYGGTTSQVPIVVRAKNDQGQTFTGLLVPLTPA